MKTYADYKKELSNVYFVNGSAYAGKSSVCKALAKKHNMYLCEENYQFDAFLKQTTKETHPHMNYFKTMSSWEEFVSRSKEAYQAWLDGVSLETTPFELETLSELAKKHDRVLVDTNIPDQVLVQIADYNHVLYMVAKTDLSVSHFFHRKDKEKQFLYRVMMDMEDPEKALKHYREILEYINREERLEVFKNSKFLCIERVKIEEDLQEKIRLAEKHFGLNHE
jgi:tRNA nucleotidyltransferase/poly(A) polymerase